VTVLIVANVEGFQALQAHLDYRALLQDLGAALTDLKDPKCKDAGEITEIALHLERTLEAQTQKLICIPDKFQRLPTESAHAPLPLSVETGIPAKFRATQCLRVDWQQVMYTDGSVAGGADGPEAARVGAGIYRPADTANAEPVAVMLDPAGAGMTNTINRAELAPILYALQHDDLSSTIIATDSACSLYQIARYIRDPSGMERHTHRLLLKMIADAILERCNAGRPVHLMKVRAHSGIVGNEMADELAKAAGGGGDEEHDGEIAVCPASSMTPMHGLYWPMYETADAAPEGGPRIRHVQDLRRHLKKQIHQELRLGHSNQDGIYFTMWQATVPIAHAASSNGFLNMPEGVDANARKLVLQARYGTLNTAKFRMRCGLAASDACLLCGSPDGGHHSLSGCSRMLEMYTLRHNEAGGIIYQALAKGGLGAALVMQDIGRHNAAGGDAEAAADIPTRLPPDIAQVVAGEKESRPDIFIAHCLMPGSESIHIVELKYCRDTDREGQRSAAISQHELLTRRLREKYPGRVHMHAITLGVTGTIYTDFLEAMVTMQVPKREAKRCATKLHVHAVKYVQRIMRTKWGQESAARAGGG
jgi:ribonuclease HI